LSDLERRGRKEPDKDEGNPYLFITLGIAFVIATVLIIATAGTPAAGIGFVIATAACLAGESPS
jgi:hypothetical protein